jgi:hypothetical protein
MAIASSSLASDPVKEGMAISNKFALVFSARGFEHSCAALRNALNQPTIFSWNLSAALLFTPDTVIWQKRKPDGGWRAPQTTGEIQSHDVPEGLSIDLDGDGVDEFVWRAWLEFKSQPYNELLVQPPSADGTRRAANLLSPEALERAREEAGAGTGPIDSFHLLEIIAAEPKPYVIALSSIWNVEHFDVPAYVMRFRRDLTLELICEFQTTVFGSR